MIWRLTRKSLTVKLERKFCNNPSVRLPKRAMLMYIDQPLPTWPPLAILGRFFVRYAQKYRREWRSSSQLTALLLKNVQQLVEREGREWLCKGIDAVFSNHLGWVNGTPMNFLLHEDSWPRFIIPAIDKMNSRRGEQSEWGIRRGRTKQSSQFTL